MTGPTSATNPDLAAVHSALVATVVKLDNAVGSATTSAQVTALLDEIAEVNARVTTIGRQLFTQQTDAIRTQSQAVLDATASVNAAIGQIEDITGFVQNVTGFLKLVDKVIGTAKLIV
jgi:predicted trehalose synthase